MLGHRIDHRCSAAPSSARRCCEPGDHHRTGTVGAEPADQPSRPSRPSRRAWRARRHRHTTSPASPSPSTSVSRDASAPPPDASQAPDPSAAVSTSSAPSVEPGRDPRPSRTRPCTKRMTQAGARSTPCHRGDRRRLLPGCAAVSTVRRGALPHRAGVHQRSGSRRTVPPAAGAARASQVRSILPRLFRKPRAVGGVSPGSVLGDARP